MRGWPAWVALGLGALLAVAGLVVMVVLGPDSRFTTGPHAVETDGTAVVTAPGVITYRGLQVDVLVEVPAGKPVFVGLGNTVDVQDYVGGTQRLEVTSFRVPWQPRTREVEGEPVLPGAPTALDWWRADSAGLGGAAISTTLPDEGVSLAILAVGATNLSGLEVTFAYGVRGGFGLGLGALLGGSGLALAGVLARRSALVPALGAEEDRAPATAVEEVEEVVYVFVDERGVEHEISAEEAARLEAALRDPAPTPTATPEPESTAVPEPEPAHAPAVAAATPAPQPPVVYVFVDEDGVEHEVSEDELADYELVDDEVVDDEPVDDEGGESR